MGGEWVMGRRKYGRGVGERREEWEMDGRIGAGEGGSGRGDIMGGGERDRGKGWLRWEGGVREGERRWERGAGGWKTGGGRVGSILM